MSIKSQIIMSSREHYKAHIRKHVTNINAILANPITIPEHTDIMDSVEKELFVISEYESKLQALDKYIKDESDDNGNNGNNGNGNGGNNGNNGNNDTSTTTESSTTTTETSTTQQEATITVGAGSHLTIERPFTV